VLTKPDTVGAEYDAWLKVIQNEKHKLHHGYYLTRLPRDEKEMQQTPAKSREVELNYLYGHEKWNKVDKSRLGTAKLAEALSTRLSLMIEETFYPFPFKLTRSLPGLKKDLLDKMRKVQRDLREIPKSLAENPQSDLISLCSAFLKDIELYTSGKPTDDPDQATFLGDATSHYDSLKKAITRTRPRFKVSKARPVESGFPGPGDKAPEVQPPKFNQRDLRGKGLISAISWF